MESLDLFSRLDRLEGGLPETQVVMARFRTRFHRDVIFSRFSVNPIKSQAEIAASVAMDEPGGFLPFPWPEHPITSEREMTKAALLKMRTIVNVGLRMDASDTMAMTSLMNKRFPDWELVPAVSGNIYSCEVCVQQDGQVIYSIQDPPGANIPESLLPTEGAWKGFAECMMILGMLQYEEKYSL